MKTVTPEELIEFVRPRKRLRLSTLSQHCRFTVRLAGDGFEYTPSKSNDPRLHQFKWVEKVCEQFSQTNSLHPGEYNHYTRNSSYTLALIAEYLAASNPVPEIQISGGGFGDAATRKKVELAAIRFVKRRLKGSGFRVEDHQRLNLGYDLLAISTSETLFVEVKGTDAQEPRFFLTRNESQCAEDEHAWRLHVVCNARTKTPSLHKYTNPEMRREFTFDCLAWECRKIGV